jgi:hypothetical protein
MEDNLERRPPFSPFRLILNCLTLVILLVTLGVGVVLAFVFINPYSAINPYPPPTLPPTLGPPTATNTPQIFLPTSWTSTPSVTFTPTETETPVPSATLTPSPTLGTTTITPTGAPFGLQPGSPVAIPNIANNDQCSWMGVGGQVFDLNDAPIVGLAVRIDGTLGGQLVLIDTLTGSAPALGPAGYVFNLSDHPIASPGTLFVQLRDNAGIPLSDRVAVSTFDTCDKNLVLVNWKQSR